MEAIPWDMIGRFSPIGLLIVLAIVSVNAWSNWQSRKNLKTNPSLQEHLDAIKQIGTDNREFLLTNRQLYQEHFVAIEKLMEERGRTLQEIRDGVRDTAAAVGRLESRP